MTFFDKALKRDFETAVGKARHFLTAEGNEALDNSLKLWAANHLRKTDAFFNLLSLVGKHDQIINSHNWVLRDYQYARQQNDWLRAKIKSLQGNMAELGFVIRDALENNWGSFEIWSQCALDSLKRILPSEYKGLDPEVKAAWEASK